MSVLKPFSKELVNLWAEIYENKWGLSHNEVMKKIDFGFNNDSKLNSSFEGIFHYTGEYIDLIKLEGVDMLVTIDGRLNPCVEVNLRNTMGHVALSLCKQGVIDEYFEPGKHVNLIKSDS